MNRTCKRCGAWVDAVAFLNAEGRCTNCALEEGMLKEIPKGGAVLDVGAGMARYHRAIHDHAGGDIAFLDAYLPYITAHKPPPGVPLFIGEAQVLLPVLREGFFDAVMAIDVVEHMVKEEGVAAIRQMQRIAPLVLLFVPIGEHPQAYDAFGMGGDYWQTHRATWEVKELEELGFTVEVWKGFHNTDDRAPDAAWAVWRH